MKARLLNGVVQACRFTIKMPHRNSNAREPSALLNTQNTVQLSDALLQAPPLQASSAEHTHRHAKDQLMTFLLQSGQLKNMDCDGSVRVVTMEKVLHYSSPSSSS